MNLTIHSATYKLELMVRAMEITLPRLLLLLRECPPETVGVDTEPNDKKVKGEEIPTTWKTIRKNRRTLMVIMVKIFLMLMNLVFEGCYNSCTATIRMADMLYLREIRLSTSI